MEYLLYMNLEVDSIPMEAGVLNSQNLDYHLFDQDARPLQLSQMDRDFQAEVEEIIRDELDNLKPFMDLHGGELEE